MTDRLPRNADPLPPGLPEESMLPLWHRIHGEFLLFTQQWGLPPGVTIILLGLHWHPDLAEPAMIARHHYLPRQTTTFLLDELERRKLAVRTAHPSDRRRKRVRLTPRGRAKASGMIRDLLRFEAQALKTLNTRHLESAKQLLSQYADGLALANRGTARP